MIDNIVVKAQWRKTNRSDPEGQDKGTSASKRKTCLLGSGLGNMLYSGTEEMLIFRDSNVFDKPTDHPTGNKQESYTPIS